MTLLKKLYSFFISIKFMLLLALTFALASAMGTFIENDYGINSSWALVYGTWWFEALQIALGISLLHSIYKYRMYRLKKFPLFLFHISFIVILIGAGLTRYFGYEGAMHIREGQTENRILSSDAYLQIKAKKYSKEYSFEKLVYISELGGKEFKTSLDVGGKKLNVTYKKFIKKAKKVAVEDSDSKALVSFSVKTPQGDETFFLKSGDFVDVGPLAIYFDKEPDVFKPILRLITNHEKIEFVCNVDIGSYKAGYLYPFQADKLYNINGVQLTSHKVFLHAKVEVVEDKTLLSSLSALLVDVDYDGINKTIALMGNGKQYKGYTENLNINDTQISLEWGAKVIELPFSLKLKDFTLINYPGSMSASSYESDIVLIDRENSIQKEHKVYMNKTLDYGGYLFFQSSYDKDEGGTILSVNHDPGKLITYLGYTLLALGLFLNFFNKNSHFYKLTQMKYKHKISIVILLVLFSGFFMPKSLSAQDIDSSYAEHYSTLLVQTQDGRIKPLDTYTTELLNKIASTDTLYGLNHNQIILGMSTAPEEWKKKEMIKISNYKVKEFLGLDKGKKRFAYVDFFDKDSAYKLDKISQKTLRKKESQRDMFDKEIIKVDERVNVAYLVYSGRFMKVFPREDSLDGRWYYPKEALASFSSQNLREVSTLLKENSDRSIDAIKEYQKKYASNIIPTQTIIDAELFYNKLKVFDRLFPIYLSLGFILLGAVFVNLLKPSIGLNKLSKIVIGILVVGFIAHTLGLGLRWYIAGHAPWSNGYEAMLYISWSIIFAGIVFARSSILAIATTAIFAGVTLFVAHLSWLNPQITTMVPVLKSYWLTIHVSIITASYGFLGLSSLLGFISLIFYLFLYDAKRQERISVNILEATRINEISMIVGLALLVVGNFLGAVWANESWGRYWGWDPKETWAWITILIYVIITHLRFVPSLKSNFIFNSMSVIGYFSVIMTYFGVNYYLSGLHSYASGDSIPVPQWVYYAISIIVLLMLGASLNRKKLMKIKPKIKEIK